MVNRSLGRCLQIIWSNLLSLERRFWAKVNRHGPIPMVSPDLGPCWLWTAKAGNGTGYGVLNVGRYSPRRSRLAHVISYELHKGFMPAGLEIDHLCRVRNCVNPAHLEAVPHAENVRRGIVGAVNGARQLAKTHCPNGHPYSGDNLYIHPGSKRRGCHTCVRDAGRRYKARKKKAA